MFVFFIDEIIDVITSGADGEEEPPSPVRRVRKEIYCPLDKKKKENELIMEIKRINNLIYH